MPFLQFKGKTAVETYHYSLPHHTLEFDTSLSVLNAEQEPTLDDNLIVEGDNLLALKALLPTHTGRIKCIYIDPPYNTGNEGWVYNDNLNQPQFKEWIGETVGKEGEDSCRHDKWCCMMFPRLQLLRQLLREDGAIFISIDDNEVGNLRVMMDEIFGEENFVSSIAWQKRYAVAGDDDSIGSMHEHIIIYCKSDNFVRGFLARTEEQDARYGNLDDDPRGNWASDNYISNKSKFERPTLFYPVIHPKTGEEVWPDENAVWRYSQTKHQQLVEDNRLYWGPTLNYAKPRIKRFLSDVQHGVVPGSWWPHTEAGHNDEAKKELSRIMSDSKGFATPKPVRLIKRILQISTNSDDEDVILDSFAGSGTTAQAILELNQEDGGNRKFILVQQKYDSKENEKEKVNICETITRERVRRVVQGYKFTGTQTETLLEEKVGLNTLKKADELLKRIEAAREEGRANYDDVRAEMKDGIVRVEGVKKIKEKTEGLGGAFAYARISEHPLFGEYRDLGNHPPSWENLAAYIFYTETSHQFNRQAANAETGKIGEHAKNSYYLLYAPDEEEGKGLGIGFLKTVAVHDSKKDLVVYSEKFVMHRDTLHKWEMENHKKVRSMLVPFNLR